MLINSVGLLLLLLLPIAALSGWYLGRKDNRPQAKKNFPSTHLPSDYFVGLNYLLNEQPDKAVDVFVKMLEVDSETVETHLALGNLFRRRGEVDRAIRIHQNLIARPNLSRERRVQSLLELGQDYMTAGVLDRAERLFIEIVKMGEKDDRSLRFLLDIYQQEKDWQQALQVAEMLPHDHKSNMSSIKAHYHCELADNASKIGAIEVAMRYLKKALSIDRNSVRASLMLADLYARDNQYKLAIRHYKHVKDQDPDYLSEAIIPLVASYGQMGNETDLIHYLKQCLLEYPQISIALVLSERLRQQENDDVATDLITQQLRLHPSIRGLDRLIELHLDKMQGSARDVLKVLNDLTHKLLEDKPIYRCHSCGFSSKTLLWQCPGCKSWGSVKPIHGLEGE